MGVNAELEPVSRLVGAVAEIVDSDGRDNAVAAAEAAWRDR
jgi:hypothetical protein